jgi:hypothetical protein
MASLSREYRRQLERVIIEARRVGEKGAVNALKALAVDHHEPLGGMTKAQRDLRNRLRAHGRQLGDRLDQQRGTQEISHLATECAYEQWHRMLFSRFLAENNLLIEPESGVALSLDECRELAREKNADWLELASSYAVKMLPQIFRPDDPVLEIALPPETRKQLEELLESLTAEVFAADDSLGWVYQSWQTDLKEEVNGSGEKIGADELPAVTQLFTEDYMVLFLLHNTLGAWWTSKRKAEGRGPNLPGYEWTYLRLKDDGTPAAGAFEGWPKLARDIKVLDPSMGSGHFLTFALPILVGFRMEEEGLAREEAVCAALRDNLFGLEIDNRCTQIAAFNLALAAWKVVGYRPLPELNLACSGLGINAREEDWLLLGGTDAKLRETMKSLYKVFRQAPVLGSLIDPKRTAGPLFAAEFARVKPLLDDALRVERCEDAKTELAVIAQGVVQAARMLSGSFTLVVTNVPYLGRGKQCDELKDFCETFHPLAKADLATCFVERCTTLCDPGGSTALVCLQNWLFLGTYKDLRKQLLQQQAWNLIARLGAKAFQTPMWDFGVALQVFSHERANKDHRFAGFDVSEANKPELKAEQLRFGSFESVPQLDQLTNPDAMISFSKVDAKNYLGEYAYCYQGTSTGDNPRFTMSFWERNCIDEGWEFFQTPPGSVNFFVSKETIVNWRRLEQGFEGAAIRGAEAFSKRGVAFGQMADLPVTLFQGTRFSNSTPVLVPFDENHLPAIWAYCSSGELTKALRQFNQKLSIDNGYITKVGFDLTRWQDAAKENLPKGIPNPYTDDPTQWIFTGDPRSEHSLQVAVARLLGYEWPRQTGSHFVDCGPVEPDGVQKFADEDGMVSLFALKGEPAAADRLRALLAAAFQEQWSAAELASHLSKVGYTGRTIQDWLRHGFFEQHCELFQQRPFVWHIWDGLKDGFGALVNYHRLTAPNGDGKRVLEKLTYGYLGDWISRQRADQSQGVEGSDARLAAAEHLQKELKKILHGEPPYDIFVRWKPLHEQPIGWEPDINDGVRVNIRPFMMAKALNGRGKSTCILRSTPKIKWDKDRGKEPHRAKEDFPWFWSWDGSTEDFAGGREYDGNRWNDLHYSIKAKREARERHKAKTK